MRRVSSGTWALVRPGAVALLVLFAVYGLSKSKFATQDHQTDSRRGTSTGMQAASQNSVRTERPVAAAPPLPHAVPTAPSRPESAAAPASPEASPPQPTDDPFARQGDEEPPARVLVAVADMQLGVLTNAKVLDAAHLTELLTKIGGEMEKLGTAPDQPARRQLLLESYQKELGRYMQGEVELRGRDWIMGFEVGEVRPLEEHWRPRPN